MARNSKAGLANFLAALLALTGLVSIAAPASAATVNCTVTTNADSGAGSLRECYEGSSLSASDLLVITFSEDFLIELDSDLIRDFPEFTAVSIVGPTRITSSGTFSGDYLLWSESYGSGLTIENMSFLDAPGTAVNVHGDLYIVHSFFEGNGSSGVDGGAVRAEGDLFVQDSHFENNEADYGGAISGGLDTTVIRSSFVGNQAIDGGAILGAALDSSDETFIFFSTFYDNHATGGQGGAVYQVDEDVFVFNSTFVENESESADSDDLYVDGEDAIVFGSIFDSQFEDYAPFSFAEDAFDLGANFLTGPDPFSVSWFGDTTVPSQFDLARSDLQLGELQLLDNGTYGFIPGPGSVAGSSSSLAEFESAYDWAVESEGLDDLWNDLFYNVEGDARIADQSGAIVQGLLSSGSIDFQAPVPYLGPVVTNDPETSQSGSTVTYTGTNLDEVISATISGQSAAIVSKSASSLTLRVPTGLTQGMHDVVLQYGSTEQITLQNGLVIQDSMKAWTKLQADNTVKMYAKNIIGEGKIQFFHNGNEIAWIRATNSLNPKLSSANGSHYLVRTRELTDGKNIFEIFDDGVRVWRAAYSR